jgi:signal peptidase I
MKPTPKKNSVIRKKSALREWIETIVIAVALALFVRTFFIELFRIPSGSMRPTFLEGDRILVSKLTYGPRIPFTGGFRLPGFRQPQRGEIIVFIYPEDPKKNFIKRLVGFPGERVQIIDGNIYINDKKLDDPKFNQRYYYNRGSFGQEKQTIVVPQDSYYVLGDNSGSSQDSRYWGFVPKKNLVGKAILIYWPFNRFRLVE